MDDGVRALMVANGVRIAKLRELRNQSPEELAYKAGITEHYLGLIERGERDPPLSALAAIAQGLGVALVDLVSPEADHFTQSTLDFLVLLRAAREPIRTGVLLVLQRGGGGVAQTQAP